LNILADSSKLVTVCENSHQAKMFNFFLLQFTKSRHVSHTDDLPELQFTSEFYTCKPKGTAVFYF